MTNLSLVVTVWVNLVTNPVPAGVTTNGQNFYEVYQTSTIQQYLPDGAYLNCNAMVHHSWITNAAAAAATKLPLPPKVQKGAKAKPRRLADINLAERVSRRTVLPDEQSGALANGGPDVANFCLMFRSRFQTKTNFIYGLESSYDLEHWLLLPPEINGTGQQEEFFDESYTNEIRVYRIAARAGSLPP